MKIYVAHSTSFDYKSELYLPIRQSDLNSQHDFILPHESSNEPYESKSLFTSTHVDLVIADVSYPSTGMGIEIGWANSCGIPIACVYHSGSKPSGTLRVVTDMVYSYTTHKELVDVLEDIINKT